MYGNNLCHVEGTAPGGMNETVTVRIINQHTDSGIPDRPKKKSDRQQWFKDYGDKADVEYDQDDSHYDWWADERILAECESAPTTNNNALYACAFVDDASGAPDFFETGPVNFKGTATMMCSGSPMALSARQQLVSADRPARTRSSTRIVPTRVSADWLIYRSIPAELGDIGGLLMENHSTPLKATRIEVVASNVNWSYSRLPLSIHRPCGESFNVPGGGDWNSAFSPEGCIYVWQGLSERRVRPNVVLAESNNPMADDGVSGDQLSMLPHLGIYVQANYPWEIFRRGPIRGSFDLFVRVLVR